MMGPLPPLVTFRTSAVFISTVNGSYDATSILVASILFFVLGFVIGYWWASRDTR